MAIFSWRKKEKKVKDGVEEDMSFFDHLEELRWHLVRSIVVILVFAAVLFSFRAEVIGGIFMTPFKDDFVTYRFMCDNFGQFCEQDIEITDLQLDAPDSLILTGILTTVPELGDSLAHPEQKEVSFKVATDQFMHNGNIAGLKVTTEQGSMVKFQAITPYEQFMKALLYAFFGGLIFAFPYVSWELWAFIRPALGPKEVKKVRGSVFASSMLFFVGILFGYFVILPFSITFLSSFVLFEEAENIWRIGDVVSFVLVLLFGTGFLFQLPIFIYYMSKIGIVTPAFLRKYRKHAVVGLLVIAAILTPPDPMSQILIFFPLICLYEVGILISARVNRKNDARKKAEKEEDDRLRAERTAKYKAEQEQQKEIEGKARAASLEQHQNSETLDGDSDEGDDAGETGTDEEDDDDLPDLGPPEGSISRKD